MTGRNLDLWAVVTLAAVGVAVQLGPVPAVVKAVGGLPLVLFCPGYAAMAALFPGRSPGWPERLLLVLGLSLGVAILGGVAFNWSPWGLQTWTWAGLFFGVTVAASLIAACRRAADPESIPARRVVNDGAPSGAPALRGASRSDRGLTLERWALLVAAGLVTVAAVALARAPRPTTGVLGYTLLWMVPDDAREGESAEAGVRLGISSRELIPTSFRLTVTLDGQLLQEWTDITLGPGESWEWQMQLPPGQAGRNVEAVLYRTATPDFVYRRVLLWR